MKKLFDKEVLISQKNSFKNGFFFHYFLNFWNVSRDKKENLLNITASPPIIFSKCGTKHYCEKYGEK